MVRGVRGLLVLGLIGLALFLCELFAVRAVQHTPMPVVVTADKAKAIAGDWLGAGKLTVRQEEDQAVSRHLQKRGMTEAFRKEAGDANKPLVMWKVTSGDATVLINRQNGRVEAVRGVTLALVGGTEPQQVAEVQQELRKRFSLQELPVSSIKYESAGRLIIEFESGYQYEGLREVISAELAGEHWVGFTHRLKVAPEHESEDLGEAKDDKDGASNKVNEEAVDVADVNADEINKVAVGTADEINKVADETADEVNKVADETFEHSVEATVRTWAGILNLAVLALPVVGFFTLWKNGFAGRRLYGESLLSAGVAIAFWLKDPSVAGLLQGGVYGAIVFGVLAVVWKGRLPLLEHWKEPDWLERQIVAGYGVFGVLAGASVLFSWGAHLLGAWSSDLQAQETVALASWPLLLPLLGAGAAAVYEELVYRKLGDVWLNRFLKSGVATALLSSLVWATAHLQYGVSPWYLRIIELTLVIGPLFFYLYRRFGLGAVITGHFLYNACLYNVALAGAFGNYWGFLWLLLPMLVLVIKKKGLRV